ncbi:uncharacterized protein [Branchiostoma lanceolatum]|uniref:uncharacterized protein n=1 Tax=Branchiostoma lanceolatum TaxID=7740 RepID=UPI0034565374
MSAGATSIFLWIISVLTLLRGSLGEKGPQREPPRVGECAPILYDRCSSVLPYAQTRFPNPLGLPDQDLALAVAPAVFTALDMVTRCPHLDTFLCSLMFPRCTPEGMRMPCRSFCRNVIRTCAGPVLGDMQHWLTLFCDALPERNCTRPAPCEPIHHATCRTLVPYNSTGFPNLLGHGSQAELLADPVTLNDTAQLINSGCHPEIGFAVCAAMVPNCHNTAAIPPCKSFCHEVREACEPTMASMGQTWPFDCNSFPDAHQGRCSSPYNETARALANRRNKTDYEPIRFPRCSALPYRHARFPNALDCEPIRFPRCSAFPYHHFRFPNTLGLLVQGRPLTAAHISAYCEPIRFPRCSALPYRHARFPTALGLPDQGLVLTVAPVVFTVLDLLQLSECSPYLDSILCSLMYQDCRSEELR